MPVLNTGNKGKLIREIIQKPATSTGVLSQAQIKGRGWLMYRFPDTRDARRKIVTLWNCATMSWKSLSFFLSVSTSLWMRIFLWDAKLSVLAACLQIPSHLPQPEKATRRIEPGAWGTRHFRVQELSPRDLSSIFCKQSWVLGNNRWASLVHNIT